MINVPSMYLENPEFKSSDFKTIEKDHSNFTSIELRFYESPAKSNGVDDISVSYDEYKKKMDSMFPGIYDLKERVENLNERIAAKAREDIFEPRCIDTRPECKENGLVVIYRKYTRRTRFAKFVRRVGRCIKSACIVSASAIWSCNEKVADVIVDPRWSVWDKFSGRTDRENARRVNDVKRD